MGAPRPTAPLPAPATMQLRCRRFLALARVKLYWMCPAWGTAAEQLPVETQLALLELEVGRGGGLGGGPGLGCLEGRPGLACRPLNVPKGLPVVVSSS